VLAWPSTKLCSSSPDAPFISAQQRLTAGLTLAVTRDLELQSVRVKGKKVPLATEEIWAVGQPAWKSLLLGEGCWEER